MAIASITNPIRYVPSRLPTSIDFSTAWMLFAPSYCIRSGKVASAYRAHLAYATTNQRLSDTPGDWGASFSSRVSEDSGVMIRAADIGVPVSAASRANGSSGRLTASLRSFHESHSAESCPLALCDRSSIKDSLWACCPNSLRFEVPLAGLQRSHRS